MCAKFGDDRMIFYFLLALGKTHRLDKAVVGWPAPGQGGSLATPSLPLRCLLPAAQPKI